MLTWRQTPPCDWLQEGREAFHLLLGLDVSFQLEPGLPALPVVFPYPGNYLVFHTAAVPVFFWCLRFMVTNHLPQQGSPSLAFLDPLLLSIRPGRLPQSSMSWLCISAGGGVWGPWGSSSSETC